MRRNGLPPSRCSGTSKASGKPCRRFVRPGATVCAFHGQNGRVIESADDRQVQAQVVEAELTLADRLGRPPRPLPEILLNAVAVADAITQEDQVRVVTDDTPEHRERLAESAERVVKIAKSALGSSVVMKHLERLEAQQAREQATDPESDARYSDAFWQAILSFCAAGDPADEPVRNENEETIKQYALDCGRAASRGEPMPERPVLLGSRKIIDNVVVWDDEIVDHGPRPGYATVRPAKADDEADEVEIPEVPDPEEIRFQAALARLEDHRRAAAERHEEPSAAAAGTDAPAESAQADSEPPENGEEIAPGVHHWSNDGAVGPEIWSIPGRGMTTSPYARRIF